MHTFDHGLIAHILKYQIRIWFQLEAKIGKAKYTVVNLLLKRLSLLFGWERDCQKRVYNRHHMNLLCLPPSIIKLIRACAGMAKDGKSKSSPIVDAHEMQRLALAMPFILLDLTDNMVTRFNRGKRAQDQVQDPTLGLSEVWEYFLKLYLNYRYFKFLKFLYVSIAFFLVYAFQ